MVALVVASCVLAGCPVARPELVTADWAFNRESLGDSEVSFVVYDGRPMEASINGGEWVPGTLAADRVSFRLALGSFEDGENVIEIREQDSSDQGETAERRIWKGGYRAPEDGDLTLRIGVSVNGAPAQDVVVAVDNNRDGASSGDLDLMLLLPDSSGHIVLDGLVDSRGLLVELDTEHYEAYWLPIGKYMWVDDVVECDVNVRDVTEGTAIEGKLLKRTDSGNIPFASDDGNILVQPYYTSGDQGIGTTAMQTGISTTDYNFQTGEYSISALAGDSYMLVVEWQTKAIRLDSYHFQVPAGQSREVNITLEGRTSPVSGVVKDDSGDPISDCYVRVQQQVSWGDVEARYRTDTITTDEEGRFTFTVPLGPATVLASRTNEYIGEIGQQAEALLEVTVGTDSEGVAITVPSQ